MYLGMYHNRKRPETISRAYLYAAIAKLEGVNFYYFNSRDVDFDNKEVTGKYYEGGEWKTKVFPFPDVVLNVVGPITHKQIDIYQRLKKMVPFTSHSVGTKLSVYNKIKKAGTFKDYLIPYKKIKEPIDVLKFIDKYQNIIIKPVSGSHGNFVFHIKESDGNYLVQSPNDLKTLSQVELLDFIDELLKQRKMIVQKYISCRKRSNEIYDFRLHLQKNGEGKWVNTIIYPKIAIYDKSVTNLGQGGQIAVLDVFLNNEFHEQYYNIKRYLEVFATQFAKHIDSLYNNRLDEIGVDIGLDDEQKIWIYEVNWRPGHVFIEYITAKNAIKYAIYIAKKVQSEKT